MKRSSVSSIFAFILSIALIGLVSALPIFADTPTVTTENITDGPQTGTRTTTVDGNTTTVVETTSGNTTGGYLTRTTTTVTNGKPTKSQTIKQTTTEYKEKGGAVYYTTTWTRNRSDYDEAGGYTEASSDITEYPSGEKSIDDINTRRDASGAILSGTRTQTHVNKDGTKVVTKKTWQDHSFQDVSLSPTPSPPLAQGTAPAPEPPKHHANALGWILGIGAVVGILLANGNHGSAASNNTGNQTVNGSGVTFMPASVSTCLNKFPTVTVSDPSHPGAQFQLLSQNTSIVQIGSATTTGPIDLTPFGVGSTNVTATEMGTSKMGTLPVTVTPAC